MIDPIQSQHYLPYQIAEDDSLNLLWLKLTHNEAKAPFYQEDVGRMLTDTALESDVVVRTAIEKLDLDQIDTVPLSGMIFHMSRCGSTLLSNMIKSIPDTIVHSEPRVIEEAFRLFEKSYDPQMVQELLKSTFDILGRKQTGEEKNYVLKLTSYSAIGLPIILRMYPKMKRVFVFRDPVEVLSSNLSDPDQFWFYSDSLLGQTSTQIIEGNTVLENCAQALKRTCESFLQAYDENCLIINYSDLISKDHAKSIFEGVLEWFGIETDQETFSNAFAEKNRYSKNPKNTFNGERDTRYQVSEKLQRVANEYLNSVYQELKAKAINP